MSEVIHANKAQKFLYDVGNIANKHDTATAAETRRRGLKLISSAIAGLALAGSLFALGHNDNKDVENFMQERQRQIDQCVYGLERYGAPSLPLPKDADTTDFGTEYDHATWCAQQQFNVDQQQFNVGE